MDISVIIPAFNEEQRIAPTLKEVDGFLSKQFVHYEIIVVDDGSSDNTVALVSALMREYSNIRCVPSVNNRGKGHAVRMGMLAAKGEVRVMYDADGSMPASEMPKLLAPVFSGQADIAIGSRYARGSQTNTEQPGWRVAWSRLANRFIQRSLVPKIADTQCGFKAFSARAASQVFSRCTIDGWAFDLEALGLAVRLGFEIEECGVIWQDDERSKISPVRDFIQVLREFWAIRGNFKKGYYGALGPAFASE